VGPEDVFEKLVDIATTAEAAGFTSLSVMDHYHQIPSQGPPSDWMFDGPTMLAGLAARTKTIALGLLVGGVTYRTAAQHAKITTTLDIISGGRAFHGIGAAWYEAEHEAYGFAFPSLKVRFERLEDHLRIARALFTEPEVDGAYNNPRPIRGDIPILIGGSGERKTLRLVAQYADGCNIDGDPERARHLLGVLERHCEAVGRDPAEITKTAESIVDFTAATTEQVVERAEELKAVGVEGLTVSMPGVHDLERVRLAGQTLAPIFGS
jgi:alkanesulfonate monooxygenase SsuD/methylene tetrahydromethanopterin reductase-like flavin-dependent oxidoreductase (luciferase family)